MFVLINMTVREMARHTASDGTKLVRVKLENNERREHAFNIYLPEPHAFGMYLGQKIQLTVSGTDDERQKAGA